jgi:calcineurin-like phosphoesterase
MEKVPSLGRFLTGTPKRFTTATDDVRVQGVLIRIDAETGRALAIERYSRNFDLSASQGKGHDYSDEQDDD